MFSFIIRRVVYGLPIILGTTLILFVIFNVVPGDPTYQVVGRHADAATIELTRHQLGLDRPLPAQYLSLVKQSFTLDFGRSYATKQDITDMIKQGLGPSLSLSVPSFLIAVIVSLVIGIIVAFFRGTWLDHTVVGLCVAGQSISLLMYILAGQFFLAYRFGWFPITGYDPDLVNRWHFLLLPGLIFITLTLAPQVRFYRTVILDELYQDYVRTARSKGLGARAVMFKHVLKNALIPIITDIIINIPYLLLGSVLLESFFGIPGIGDLIVRAIANSDRPVLIAITVLGAMVYVVLNVVADVLYAVVDPRVQVK